MAKDEAYPPALEAAESALVTARRRKARANDAREGEWTPDGRLPADTVGFGLSGGGIRSATFCLGVFQAIAAARRLGDIDFLSTVSGGGYFGSFLGRLFSRADWVTSVGDAESALGARPKERTEWGHRSFRWLRDNGRYLAPRGSGDLLLLGTALFRNWLSVQAVMVTTVLTLFVGLQFVRRWLEQGLGLTEDHSTAASLLAALPWGDSLLWWSPWGAVLVLLILATVPAGWAYWLVTPPTDRGLGDFARHTVVVTVIIGVIGTVWYFPGRSSEHPLRFLFALLLAVTGILVLVYWQAGRILARKQAPDGVDAIHLLRNMLTRLAKLGLISCIVVLAWTLVDTFGGSIYRAASTGDLPRWGASVFAAFAGIGVFARPLVLLLGPTKAARPTVSRSTLAWIAAVVVVTVWLITINVGSHAVAWSFKAPGLEPATALHRPDAGFAAVTLGILCAFTFMFGRTWNFANMSSIHAFYAARLTRTFLGASNPARLREDTAVTDTIEGDDSPSSNYWYWPNFDSHGRTDVAERRPSHQRPWEAGGPLHLVNTTINETVDSRTKVQNQDRKGTSLAIGPCALSAGIRHHLVQPPGQAAMVFPQGSGHSVFKTPAEGGRTPEMLSLGRWMSISGAAFSAAAGANTSVPIAILGGMFNVRLGYWWNSGVPPQRGRVFEWLLPVQSALLAETLARTTGTAGTHWNLSDGGHFENMGGYELIRRRVPIIVIIDAEADPDFSFQGLADLVRKARLDFEAEVVFLSEDQLKEPVPTAGTAVESLPVLPESALSYFGNLDAIRRGQLDRNGGRAAHAAMARVTYLDGSNDVSWLVYIKATLTGEEPEDVCHYRRSHPTFPQETTMDQFFDEAQWESYRRLGLHIGHRVLTADLFAHLKKLARTNRRN